MNTETCLEIQAYVDGELDAPRRAAVEQLCAAEPEACSLRESLMGVRDTLRTHEPECRIPDTREFYWSQIQRRIATVEKADPAASARPSGLLAILRWLVPAAGVVTVAMVLTMQQQRDSAKPTAFASMNDAPAAVSAVVYRSDSDGVTVHWIN